MASEPPAPPETDRAAWAARFGWLVGGAVGLVAGFLAAYALEVWVLRARVGDATAGGASDGAGSPSDPPASRDRNPL